MAAIRLEKRIELVLGGTSGRERCPSTRLNTAVKRRADQFTCDRRQSLIIKCEVKRHGQVDDRVDQRSVQIEHLYRPRVEFYESPALKMHDQARSPVLAR